MRANWQTPSALNLRLFDELVRGVCGPLRSAGFRHHRPSMASGAGFRRPTARRSWISVRRKLRAGGLVYVSYNCLPGWAPAIPVRQLMTLYGDYGGGQMASPEGTIEGALKFSTDVLKTGQLFSRESVGGPPAPTPVEREQELYRA